MLRDDEFNETKTILCQNLDAYFKEKIECIRKVQHSNTVEKELVLSSPQENQELSIDDMISATISIRHMRYFSSSRSLSIDDAYEKEFERLFSIVIKATRRHNESMSFGEIGSLE